MRINWRAPRYALLVGIAVGLVVYFILTACVTVPPPRPLALEWTDCRGMRQSASVEIRYSNAPAVECTTWFADRGWIGEAAMMALQVPLACTIVDRTLRLAIVILPTWATPDLIEHEIAHVVGMSHPPFLPWPQTWCGEDQPTNPEEPQK